MIVLLAIGNPAYGKFAWNLAVSIKHFNKIPIQVIYEDSALSHMDKRDYWVFDKMTKIKNEHCRHANGKLYPAKAKLMLPKYAAYDKCIYLDVDAICVKPIQPLVDKLSGYYRTEVNGEITGGGGTHWAKERVILAHYGLSKGIKIPAINSSFVYFEKGEKCDALYQTANELLDNPIPLKGHSEKWGRSREQPDELYMNIALGITGTKANFISPIFFRMKQAMTMKDLKEHHYFLGFFGTKETNHRSMYEFYDTQMRKILKGMGLRHRWQIGNLMQDKFITRQWS